jgi:hypothetical protein
VVLACPSFAESNCTAAQIAAIARDVVAADERRRARQVR